MKYILILRTNIKRHQLRQVGALLDNLTTVHDWYVDFEDCDRVLRVESSEHLQEVELIQLLTTDGIWCEDLDPDVTFNHHGQEKHLVST